ncbi:MAG: efflux RND transporter permease subunit [Pirellulales bacterium]
MIEKIIDYSVRNPLAVVVLALALAAWGIYATIHTPVDAIPDLSENQVIVFADWQGRSPKEVEDQVTYPLSVNLQGLAGVKAIRATSEFGFSMLNIIFEDSVDFYFARERVLEKLSIAATFLPAGVAPYLAPDTTALGQIFWYTVEGEGYDIGRLRAIQDWFVRYQLYSVPGVAEVASVGGFPIEYQIDVDPNKLRAYNVSLGELYMAVSKSNSTVGGRVIQKGNSEYLVRSAGWIESLSDIEQTVIKSVEGTPVSVGDVAAVQFGSAQRRNVLEKNGNEAVGGVVLMRYGENPLTVTERIKHKIEQLQSGLPEGVRIVPFYDRTRLIHSAIDTVTSSLVEESIVASLVITIVMWHFRSALIICLMLPLATLVSFILMRELGISSNIMSLSGIAISIGVLVDAAIVMVDQGAHTLHGHFGRKAVHGDTRELLLPSLRTVGRPIFFSLAIMIISFIPVFALGGMEGKMFHPLAYTKSFALIGVSVLAITLVPALIPWLVRGRIRHEEDSWIVRRVVEIYRPVLSFVMNHPWPVVWAVGVIYLLGAIPTGSPWVFSVALASVLGMNIWASWGEEDSFHKHWWWVAVLWFAGLSIALGIGIAKGWKPEWVPQWLVGNTWIWFATAVVCAAIISVVAVRLLSSVRYAATLTVVGSLVLIGLVAKQTMSPLGREFMPPLDEGSILDMPVTVPRASITQAADDLKARDAELCAFPEVELVVGKTGRAETPTDPAPLDMVETVVNLRPREFWPKRELRFDDATDQTRRIVASMQRHGLLRTAESEEIDAVINDATMLALQDFDATLRSMVLQEFGLFEQQLAPELTTTAVAETIHLIDRDGKLKEPVSKDTQLAISEALAPKFGPLLAESPDSTTVAQLSQAVTERLVALGLVEASSDLLVLAPGPMVTLVERVMDAIGIDRATFNSTVLSTIVAQRDRRWGEFMQQLNWQLHDRSVPLYTRLAVGQVRKKALEMSKPDGGALAAVEAEANAEFSDELMLWQRTKDGLLKEMDSVVQMPGWGNIWTQPIINRVDMLATGVNTMLGVRVFGDDINKIAASCNEIAEVLRGIRGAVDVSADQVVGEGYLEIDIDREKAARYGVSVGDIQDVIETALGGKVITMTVEGRERFPVRIRYARAFREDEQSVRNLLVSAASGMTSAAEPMPQENADRSMPSRAQIPLSQVADITIVQGPSMIRSENGLLRSYVRLNVRDRDIVGFVEEARQAVASKVGLPPGMYIEWTGQFEHELRARRTLSIIVPAVVIAIFLILYITYHDLADTLIVMFLTVPGAIFGGVLFQYLFGFNFSVAVWVGFIACFGLATEGGLVILVYLREAIDARGGLENMTLAEVRQAVMDGAVHRTRPKLMTELTTMIGLAPMLWATGTGAEIMQPMAAPVLGGILVSDEVIDLLLPVLFYRVRAWRWRKIHRLKLGDGEIIEKKELAAA